MALDYTSQNLARGESAGAPSSSTWGDYAEGIITGAMESTPYLAGFGLLVDTVYDKTRTSLPGIKDYTDVINAPSDLADDVKDIANTSVEGLKWLVIGGLALLGVWVVF